jgi:signal transduction histidine kinase
MLRIPWRLVTYILIPLGILISLLGWRILSELEQEVEAKMVREVEIIGRALQAPVRRAILENRDRQIQEALDSIFTIGSVYGAFVYDKNGRLLARVGRGGDDPRYRGYIVDVLEGTEDTGQYVNFEDIRVYSAFIPVTDALEGPLGLIQINRDRGEIRSSMGNVRLKGAFISIGLILVSALVVMAGHYIAQGKAVSQLMKSIDRIEKGDRNHRASVSGPKEIATLALALNRMMDSLNSAEDEIRERKAVEQILREQASRNSRLMSLGKLAGGVAHELGAPLSVILGLIRRLKRNETGDDSGKRLQWISQLESEVRRTEAVVGQLLDFGSRRQRYEPTQPARVIDKAVEAALPDLNANNCRMAIHLPDGDDTFETDPLRLSLALRNLLSNSARHAPGTEISMTARIHESEVSFVVRDMGEGIPAGMEDRIFEPFVSTTENGHGLGLALVQQVAREHNGIVRARNRKPGCEFRMVLPRTQTAEKS